MLLQAPVNRQVAIAIFVYEGLLLPLLYSRGNYVLPACFLGPTVAKQHCFLGTTSLLRRTATLIRIRPFGYDPSNTQHPSANCSTLPAERRHCILRQHCYANCPHPASSILPIWEGWKKQSCEAGSEGSKQSFLRCGADPARMGRMEEAVLRSRVEATKPLLRSQEAGIIIYCFTD